MIYVHSFQPGNAWRIALALVLMTTPLHIQPDSTLHAHVAFPALVSSGPAVIPHTLFHFLQHNAVAFVVTFGNKF
jgi:hypothetical protein